MKLNLNIPLRSLSTKELDILQYVHDHSDNISSISIQQFANELNYSAGSLASVAFRSLNISLKALIMRTITRSKALINHLI